MKRRKREKESEKKETKLSKNVAANAGSFYSIPSQWKKTKKMP